MIVALSLANIDSVQVESPLKYQHRCVAIFKDKKNAPTGERNIILRSFC